jgi:hypothetical protein
MWVEGQRGREDHPLEVLGELPEEGLEGTLAAAQLAEPEAHRGMEHIGCLALIAGEAPRIDLEVEVGFLGPEAGASMPSEAGTLAAGRRAPERTCCWAGGQQEVRCMERHSGVVSCAEVVLQTGEVVERIGWQPKMVLGGRPRETVHEEALGPLEAEVVGSHAVRMGLWAVAAAQSWVDQRTETR